MGDFKDLRVWRESRQLAVTVDALAAGFPGEERYALAAQIRSAVASIALNIAEATGRSGAREQAQFYRIALGSAREVESALLLAADRKYVEAFELQGAVGACRDVQRMLSGLIRYCNQRLRRRPPPPSP